LGHLPWGDRSIVDIGKVCGAGAREERFVGFLQGPEHIHLPLDLALQSGH
jgi:hypothetical protein